MLQTLKRLAPSSTNSKPFLSAYFFSRFVNASPTKPKLIRRLSQEALQQRERLVVVGTNLGSTVGYRRRFTKQIRNMIKLAPYQQSVIVGLLLSDAWLGLTHYCASILFLDLIFEPPCLSAEAPSFYLLS
jgi:hypothetical protein